MMLKNSDVKHKKKCTQLYICELCFAFIRHILRIYSCFVHVNWATHVCIVSLCELWAILSQREIT